MIKYLSVKIDYLLLLFSFVEGVSEQIVSVLLLTADSRPLIGGSVLCTEDLASP